MAVYRNYLFIAGRMRFVKKGQILTEKKGKSENPVISSVFIILIICVLTTSIIIIHSDFQENSDLTSCAKILIIIQAWL
jgi:hypothetical protein